MDIKKININQSEQTYNIASDTYDVTSNNDGVTFESLSALLGSDNLSTLIPSEIRCGGMTIRFVQSSDNKYVQYRYLRTLVNSSSFIDISNWKDIGDIFIEESNIQSLDLTVNDDKNNVLALFKNGHFQTKNFDSASIDTNNLKDGAVSETKIDSAFNEKIVITRDVSFDGDLTIEDVAGNHLALFKNGHFQTKNFDSSMFFDGMSIKKFAGKSIGIIGDSISTYSGWLPSNISGYDGAAYPSYYPKQNVDNVEKTWWYQVAKNLSISENRISNCSWSGSRVSGDSTTTNTAAAGCSTRRVVDLTARGFTPDIIICFISCNDWSNNVEIGNWKVSDAVPSEGNITTMRTAYALLLSKLEVAYPSSRIFVCGNLPDIGRDHDFGFPSNNANGATVYEWNENIKEVANAFGCHFIDLYQCGANYYNYETLYSIIRGVGDYDRGLHPNAEGMKLLANLITKELINNY